MNAPLRLKSYNQTAPAGTEARLHIKVGYVWLVQSIVVSTNDPADAAKPAVVYTGSVGFDSIVAAGPTLALAAGSVATFTLNGAVEFQENYIVAVVEGSVGRVSVTVFVEESLISNVRARESAPGMSHAVPLAQVPAWDGED